jgi:hypothetical protein
MHFRVSGLPFRIVEGGKGSGDLRIEWQTPDGWRAIHMVAVFALVDFFTENEDLLSMDRPHWRKSGYRYFLDELASAMRDGYQVPSRKLEEQRRRMS